MDAELLKDLTGLGKPPTFVGTTQNTWTFASFRLEVEEELSTMATQYWAEGVWAGKRLHEQKRSADEANSRSSDVGIGERAGRCGDEGDP